MPVLIRRRPLLRAAAIGGGAYYAGRQRQQAPSAPVQAPVAAGAKGGPSMIEQLTQLGKLHEQGVLTDEEFAQQKAKLLAS